MMNWLLRLASERWPEWFAEPPPPLKIGLLGGGPAHRGRATAFIFGHGERAPRVVFKLTFTEIEHQRLANEFHALRNVQTVIPDSLRSTIPEALGLYQTAGASTVAVRALDGRRFLVPKLGGRGSPIARRLMKSYFSQAFCWSTSLADATRLNDPVESSHLEELVVDFIRATSPKPTVSRELRAFARSVGNTRITWHPAWQHGDLTVGNVLVHRGQMRFVDWEHARPCSEPWFDLAYIPTATADLARKQVGVPTVRDAALQILRPDAWLGRLLADEVRAVWSYPLPYGWAVALAAIATALRGGPGGWRHWSNFVADLLCDRELRQTAAWLVP